MPLKKKSSRLNRINSSLISHVAVLTQRTGARGIHTLYGKRHFTT